MCVCVMCVCQCVCVCLVSGHPAPSYCSVCVSVCVMCVCQCVCVCLVRRTHARARVRASVCAAGGVCACVSVRQSVPRWCVCVSVSSSVCVCVRVSVSASVLHIVMLERFLRVYIMCSAFVKFPITFSILIYVHCVCYACHVSTFSRGANFHYYYYSRHDGSYFPA